MLDTVFDRTSGAGRAFATHVASLSVTKLADGLIDPKLVLSWVMSALGAPAALIGALVPLREAGALLPQMALARPVQASRRRKYWWVVGSAVQGAAALAMAASILFLPEEIAPWAIIAALTVLALARSACSISYKDALARSVEKTRRGQATGAAGAIASMAVLVFGGLLALGVIPLSVPAIAAVIAVAGGLWLVGAALFTTLPEEGDAATPQDRQSLSALFTPLWQDGQLARFVLARAFLTVTALAPPFIVALSAAQTQSGLGQLGPLVLASALAAILSSYVWGWLSDRSSRLTMVAGGIAAGGVFSLCAVIGDGLGGAWGAGIAIFFAQIAYQGVRAGRSLHITDMTRDDTRAPYAALANTVIGVVLLAGGAFGLLGDILGLPTLLGIFAVLSLFGAAIAWTLEDVQLT